MEEQQKGKLKQEIQKLGLLAGDVLIICIVSILSLLVRFDLKYDSIPIYYLDWMYGYLPAHIICTLIIFYFCKMYRSLWRYASISEMVHIVEGAFLSTALQWIVMWSMKCRMPISFHLMTLVFLICFTALERFAYRILLEMKNRYINMPQQGSGANVMIIGAGDAGRVMLTEITASQYIQGKVVCFIDDDVEKIGKRLNGIPIVGGREQIIEAAKNYCVDEIIVALPSISAKERSIILNICQETNCHVRILPGVYQLINGEVSITKLRQVEVEDLLGREQIQVDLDSIMGIGVML